MVCVCAACVTLTPRASFVPTFFDADISDGRPRLTAAGRKALDGEGMLEGYD